VNAPPRLIAFTDLSRAPRALILERFAALAAEAQPASVLFVVRDYAASARARWELGQDLKLVSQASGQLLGVADRADIAAALGAHALHLPESGLADADARRVSSPGIFVSRARHEPRAALSCAADAVLLSPIFEARKGRAGLGLEVLARVCAQRGPSSPWVYALGGASSEQAHACLSAGAAGIAVIGAALEPDPRPLLRALEIGR